MIYDTIAWVVTQKSRDGEAYKLCKSLETLFLVEEDAVRTLEEMGETKEHFKVEMVIVRSATTEEVDDYQELCHLNDGIKYCAVSECGAGVVPKDPYYETPCGTFCQECMPEHLESCGKCRQQFSLER